MLKQADSLGRRIARAEMEKEGSLADAILGAPIGAIAARIAAPEESKKKATINGLLLGALMGFAAGQRSVQDHQRKMRGEPAPSRRLPEISPLVAAALAGAAVGGVERIKPLVGNLSKAPEKK
jgi:hypothetical protein